MANCSNKYEFCFHSVGHGLFYTGKVDKFWFIYDCGSKLRNRVKMKIQNFCETHLEFKRLLFLFLSHLHIDHVSGLKTLLNSVQVDYIFLPYLSPWERLLLALQAPSTIPAWYIEFLVDPAGYLIKETKSSQKGEKKKTKIVFVVNIPDENQKKENIDFENDNNVITVKFNGLKKLEKNQLGNILQEEDNPDLEGYYKNGDLIIANAIPKSNEVNERKPDKENKLWEFMLYTIPMRENALDCFLKKISELLRDEQFFGKEINGKNILNILLDKKKYERLKKNYVQLVNSNEKLNITSLVLWHSPISLKHIKASLRFGYCDTYNNNMDCCKEKLSMDLCFRNPDCLQISAVAAALKGNLVECGQLLTGDLDLKSENIYKDFKSFFGNKLNSTFFSLLPHHGSRHNWNNKLLEDIKPGEFWIVSAGDNEDSNYPPHGEVFMDVIQSGKMLFSTSAGKDFVVSFHERLAI